MLVMILEFIYIIFVLELIYGFIEEGALKGGLVMGLVFGFPVSGLITYRLAEIYVTGPELWTGGGFGPEAGLVLIPALILGFVLIYGYTRKYQGDEDNVQERTNIS